MTQKVPRCCRAPTLDKLSLHRDSCGHHIDLRYYGTHCDGLYRWVVEQSSSQKVVTLTGLVFELSETMLQAAAHVVEPLASSLPVVALKDVHGVMYLSI